ncbi:MAG: protein phosphatase 2C domain-containing protein [Micrococcus sp.]|nr:protein phosphatase 2C domain-containing protein [Micrococcus sp.]
MPYVLHYAARSDVGRVRAKNDDSAYVGRHLAVLADGMGGHVGGDVASASTVLDLAPLDAVGYEDPATVLPDEIQNANLILNELVHANPKLAGMGTTCTAGLLADSTFHMAHVGDSRAYRLKDGQFEQITRDHTFVQRLVDEGRLAPEEAEHHPNKNVLMRVLGDVDASPELDVFSVDVTPGERWLFCSDGLTDVVPNATIHQVLASPELSLNEVVDDLVTRTLKGGAPDNVTIIVVEIAEGTEEELTPVGEVHLSEAALKAARSGDHGAVTGVLLREELDARPHLLVGAASSAIKTDRIPIVTRASTRRRAAVLLGEEPTPQNRPQRTAALLTSGHEALPTPGPTVTGSGSAAAGVNAGTVGGVGTASTTGAVGTAHAAGTAEAAPELSTQAAAASEEAAADPAVSPTRSAPASAAVTSTAERSPQDQASTADPDPATTANSSPETGRRHGYRRGIFVPVFATMLALILGVVLVWGYLWTQTQYFVGDDNGRVAVFKGVPQQLGPLELSELDRSTDISLDSLTGYARTRVQAGIPARDLEHADRIVEDLAAASSPTSTSSPAASSSPSPTPSPTDRPTGTQSPDAQPSDAATDQPGGADATQQPSDAAGSPTPAAPQPTDSTPSPTSTAGGG